MSHLRKNIVIKDYYIGYNGLELGYELNGVPQLIEADMDSTIDLLVGAGIVEYRNGELHHSGIIQTWSDFVLEECLDEEHYKDIIIYYHNKLLCRAIMKRA